MNINLDCPALTDRQLIERHLDGDRDAFRCIVERHQAMVCALGLSACGDVSRSEDLAQEVFIVAWKQLPELREPEKLRGWLAGITRNLINNAFRRQQRTPTARAEELTVEIPSDGAGPREQAISADETFLMWHALAGIPENYREPMVLFYREQRSVTAVAAALEISEEAVRQRLVRGRAMLTERMAKLVEETLERSAPTPAFAGAVLLAVPTLMAPTVVETTLGAGSAAAKTLPTAAGVVAVAKGGLAFKLLVAVAALPMLLTGLTDYLRFRGHLVSSAHRDRSSVVRSHVMPLLVNAAVLVIVMLFIWGVPAARYYPIGFGVFVCLLVAGTYALIARHFFKIGMEEGAHPGFEFRSRGGWLGLPWVHVRIGGEKRWAKTAGWIVLSDGVAVGGLFASAPLAVAPISMGNMAVGLVSLGGLALGFGALGGVAVGWWAAGGLAVGWQAAWGGIALAHEFAVGSVAIAAQANDSIANGFVDAHGFFQFIHGVWRLAVWTSFFAWVPSLVLIGWHERRTRRAR